MERIARSLGAAVFEALAVAGDPRAGDLYKALVRAVPVAPPKRPKFAPVKDGDWDHDVRGLHPEEHTLHMRHHEAEFRGLMAQFHALDPKAEDFDVQKGDLVRGMRQCAQHWQAHRLAKHAPQVPAGAPQAGKKRPLAVKKAVEPTAPVDGGQSPVRAFAPEMAGLGELPSGFTYTVEQFQRDLRNGPVPMVSVETRRAPIQFDYHGLPIRIETNAGQVRRGKGWESTMRYAYGEIEGTLGVDGDLIDVFVGTNPTAPDVYVIHIHDLGRVKDWPGGLCPACGDVPANCPHDLDEDKVMLGFGSAEEAEAVFRVHYDSEAFLGPMSVFPFAEFRARVQRGERPMDLS